MQNTYFKLKHDRENGLILVPFYRNLQRYMFVEPGDSLYTYTNKLEKQIYLSPFKLKDTVIKGEFQLIDKPGAYAEVTSALKEKNINICKYSDIAIGGCGLIAAILDLETAGEIPPNYLETLIDELEDCENVHRVRLSPIFPDVPGPIKEHFWGELRVGMEVIKCKEDKEVIRLKPDIFGATGIDLELEKEQLGLISCLTKIHLIILNFYKSDEFIEFYYEHKDRPGAISRALQTLKKYVDIKGTNHGTSTDGNGRWRGYGILIGKNINLEDIANELKELKDYNPKIHKISVAYVKDIKE